MPEQRLAGRARGRRSHEDNADDSGSSPAAPASSLPTLDHRDRLDGARLARSARSGRLAPSKRSLTAWAGVALPGPLQAARRASGRACEGSALALPAFTIEAQPASSLHRPAARWRPRSLSSPTTTSTAPASAALLRTNSCLPRDPKRSAPCPSTEDSGASRADHVKGAKRRRRRGPLT